MRRMTQPARGKEKAEGELPSPASEGILRDSFAMDRPLDIKRKASSGNRLEKDEEALLFKVIGQCDAALEGSEERCADGNRSMKYSWLSSIRAHARNALVESSQDLVRYMARSTMTSHKPTHVKFDDLVQAGNEALLKSAIPRFRPERGFYLSTYSRWWLRHAMDAEIAHNEHTVRPQGGRDAESRMVISFARDFRAENGREPTGEEIAHVTDMPIGRVEELLKRKQKREQAIRTRDADSAKVKDRLVQGASARPDNQYERMELARRLVALLPRLDVNQETVIRKRFGLDGEEMTLEELGARLSLTRERIRQIEGISLDRVRRLARFEGLL